MSKLLEKIILNRVSDNLVTNPNQFGFKPKHNTEMCIFALKEAVLKYRAFNKSFLTGIVPSKLKIAKVIPLYKAKDPALFSNYRPISLLPVFSKILERLMYNRLYNFLTEHNILSTNQFGFRKKYSTFLALMDLVDNISKNIDEGNYSIGIFLDLQISLALGRNTQRF